MDPGSIIPNTVMCGALTWGPTSGLTAPMDTGFTQTTMNGCGSPTMNGVGRLSTMAAGSSMIIMAGYGSRVMNGHLPGFAGEAVAIITAGRHWARSSA